MRDVISLGIVKQRNKAKEELGRIVPMDVWIRRTVIVKDFLDFLYYRLKMKCLAFVNRMRKQLLLGDNVQSILIMRLASIGDVIRSTAVVESLKVKYPNAKIDYLTSSLTLPVLEGNPQINKIYTPKNLVEMGSYDWVIVLQRTEPPQGFLQDGATLVEILDFLSNKTRYKLITGKHLENGKEMCQTNAMYCHTEMEELFLISLLKYDIRHYPKTKIYLNPIRQAEVKKKFHLDSKAQYLGIFLGTNSEGGYDDGARTYSLPYINKLVEQFYSIYTIVIFGQSSVKTESELQYFDEMVKRNPKIVNLVDKTSLGELAYVLNEFTWLISCDSGPLHIGMAVGVPVIGLFSNNAGYKVCPTLVSDKYLLVNSLTPCFKYSWRGKFDFPNYQTNKLVYYDTGPEDVKHKLDLIPVENLLKGMRMTKPTDMPLSV